MTQTVKKLTEQPQMMALEPRPAAVDLVESQYETGYTTGGDTGNELGRDYTEQLYRCDSAYSQGFC